MGEIVIAAPGDLATRTGGYRYDAKVLAELASRRHVASYLPLPADFPSPSEASIERALTLLGGVRREAMLVVDGLAFGALPDDGVTALGRPVAALVHHPLAMETGLAPETGARLEASERAALGAAALVILTGPAMREIMIERYGVPPAKIRVAEPGVDVVPRARGGRSETPALLTVGTVTPRKNHLAVARALSRLTELPWRWRVVGSLERDPGCAEALRAAIADGGISDRVELSGELDEAGLAKAYDGADLFVLVSRFEGYGMVFVEALARAIPVVAGRCPAVEANVPETVGALVEPDDVAAIAEALKTLLGDPAALKRAARYAKSAGARLPRWFQTADVFEHLMAKHAAGEYPA